MILNHQPPPRSFLIMATTFATIDENPVVALAKASSAGGRPSSQRNGKKTRPSKSGPKTDSKGPQFGSASPPTSQERTRSKILGCASPPTSHGRTRSKNDANIISISHPTWPRKYKGSPQSCECGSDCLIAGHYHRATAWAKAKRRLEEKKKKRTKNKPVMLWLCQMGHACEDPQCHDHSHVDSQTMQSAETLKYITSKLRVTSGRAPPTGINLSEVPSSRAGDDRKVEEDSSPDEEEYDYEDLAVWTDCEETDATADVHHSSPEDSETPSASEEDDYDDWETDFSDEQAAIIDRFDDDQTEGPSESKYDTYLLLQAPAGGETYGSLSPHSGQEDDRIGFMPSRAPSQTQVVAQQGGGLSPLPSAPPEHQVVIPPPPDVPNVQAADSPPSQPVEANPDTDNPQIEGTPEGDARYKPIDLVFRPLLLRAQGRRIPNGKPLLPEIWNAINFAIQSWVHGSERVGEELDTLMHVQNVEVSEYGVQTVKDTWWYRRFHKKPRRKTAKKSIINSVLDLYNQVTYVEIDATLLHFLAYHKRVTVRRGLHPDGSFVPSTLQSFADVCRRYPNYAQLAPQVRENTCRVMFNYLVIRNAFDYLVAPPLPKQPPKANSGPLSTPQKGGPSSA